MIREATEEDIPRIVALGSQSLIDGPYAGKIKDNPAQTEKLAQRIISDPNGRVLLWEDEDGSGRVSGLLAFIIYAHYFTGEPTANEIMWYVEPGHRGNGAGFRLLWAAEKLALELGAINMAFSAPTNQVGEIYKRFGYHQVEVGYQKELTHARN